eukprot:PhF_6_TR14961/c0_g1_i1/m.23483
MYAAGAEYFAPLEEYDRDTLRRYAEFCTSLRNLTKPQKSAIENCTRLAVEVQHPELVAAAVMRHIRSASTDRKLPLWYLLDSLVKKHESTFVPRFEPELEDLALEGMPWEVESAMGKLRGLVDSWQKVFPQSVLRRLDKAREERIKMFENKALYEKRRREEEVEWRKEEEDLEEAEGLDEYAQPCLRYLQGKCEYGDSCKLYHPEGKEGTLPPEARPGDWACDHCGSVNRHWRRRCFYCVGEKPQWRKGTSGIQMVDPEDERFHIFRQQFGYDPVDKDAAVTYWSEFFQGNTIDDWVADRSSTYRVRILGRAPRNDGEAELRTTVHYRDAATITTTANNGIDTMNILDEEGYAAKKRAMQSNTATIKLPQVPKMPCQDQVTWLHNKLSDMALNDPTMVGYFCQLTNVLKEAVVDNKTKLPDWIAYQLLDCYRIAFHSFLLERNKKGIKSFVPALHFASPFFTDIQGIMSKLVIPVESKWELEAAIQFVLNDATLASAKVPKVGLPRSVRGSAGVTQVVPPPPTKTK